MTIHDAFGLPGRGRGRPKAVLPRSAEMLVTRPRLLARLAERFDRRLVLVQAGSGFGKSTLLAQAAAENRLDPRGLDVWLTCTPDDAAASQLAAGLLAAVDDDPVTAAQPVEAICAAVWRRAPAEVALLLDDAHLVPPDSSGAALLAELVRALPANGHLLVAGRTDPPLGWTRLAAAGEVVEVREADLTLTGEELTEFARLRDLDPDLFAGTAGWPALAALTATTGRRRTVDFLREEVLAVVPPAERRLLAAVAIAGGADDAMATALAGRPVAVTELIAGLPLISQDEHGWIRVHALWQPALDRELTVADVTDVRRTAGRVLHHGGQIAAAARLYLDGAAWNELDRLIVETCQMIDPVVGNDVLAEWLRRLPPDRRGGPTASLLEATLLRVSDPPTGRALLGHAAAGYRTGQDVAGEVACLNRLALAAWWHQDAVAVEHLLPRVIELTTASQHTPAAGGALAALSLWVHVVRAEVSGDTARALSALNAIPGTRFSGDWQTVFYLHRGLAHLDLGDLPTALQYAEQAVAGAAITARPRTTLLLLACLHALGRWEELLARLPDMFTAAEPVAQNRVAQNALAALWMAWAGRTDQAAEYARAAAYAAQGVSTPRTPVFLTLARLATALAADDAAAPAFATQLHHLCAGQPSLSRLVDRITLTVQYVLVPALRADWDAQTLPGAWMAGRELARRIVAARAGDPVELSDAPAPDVVRMFLPTRWINELAAAGGGAATLVAGARGTVRAPEPPIHVQLLGPIQLLRDGKQIIAPELRRGRVRELLAYLVIHGGASRDSIAAELWPDLEPTASALNLRVTLSHLVRLLERDRASSDHPQLLSRTASRIDLIKSPRLTADVWMFQRLVDKAEHAERQHAPSVALARYQDAVATYTGPPLADQPIPEWLLPHRDQLNRKFVTAAVRAGDLLLASGALAEPLHLARRALAIDPYSEPAHQLLISAHLAAGNRTAARHALDDCHHMLHALGALPDARTRMLSRQLGGITQTTSASQVPALRAAGMPGRVSSGRMR